MSILFLYFVPTICCLRRTIFNMEGNWVSVILHNVILYNLTTLFLRFTMKMLHYFMILLHSLACGHLGLALLSILFIVFQKKSTDPAPARERPSLR